MIENVSDTAFWVAVHRATETDRADALFRDPYARRLAGERGMEIARQMPYGDNAWPMIVRTAVLDELILRTIGQDGVGCVVNVAAGLDTRPYRLDLPEDLVWIEVDLPAVVAHKERHLAGEPSRCRLKRVAADLSDPVVRRQTFERVAAVGREALVVAEGLLVYLPDAQVADLARYLADQPLVRRWLFDLCGPLAVEIAKQRIGSQLEAGGAAMVFGPAEGPTYFTRYGWDVVEDRFCWDEAIRLGREPEYLARYRREMSPERLQARRAMSRLVLLASSVV